MPGAMAAAAALPANCAPAATPSSPPPGPDPMRLALLTDLHANLEALDACLAHARLQKADSYAFLGDFVGYGADPKAVVDTVMAHVAQGAIAVQGNHDFFATCGERPQ